MADASHNPTFSALPSKVGSEWYVLVSWHDGRVPEHVTGFQSEAAALAWITEESPEWLRNKSGTTSNGSSPQAPRDLN
jgi:hypothetical protein